MYIPYKCIRVGAQFLFLFLHDWGIFAVIHFYVVSINPSSESQEQIVGRRKSERPSPLRQRKKKKKKKKIRWRKGLWLFFAPLFSPVPTFSCPSISKDAADSGDPTVLSRLGAISLVEGKPVIIFFHFAQANQAF